MLKTSEKYKKLKARMRIDFPLEKIKEYMKLSPEKKLEFLEEINLLNCLAYSEKQDNASLSSSKEETS